VAHLDLRRRTPNRPPLPAWNLQQNRDVLSHLGDHLCRSFGVKLRPAPLPVHALQLIDEHSPFHASNGDRQGEGDGPAQLQIPRYNLSMPHTYEEVRQFAQELPEDEQIQLANSLWERVASGEVEVGEAEIAAAWGAEIAHRVEQIKAGTAVTYSLQEVTTDLRAIVGP
jgi:putative addiction module component (TIGR02574 family)